MTVYTIGTSTSYDPAIAGTEDTIWKHAGGWVWLTVAEAVENLNRIEDGAVYEMALPGSWHTSTRLDAATGIYMLLIPAQVLRRVDEPYEYQTISTRCTNSCDPTAR